MFKVIEWKFILLQIFAAFFVAESFSQLILLLDVSFINAYHQGHSIVISSEFTDQEILKNLQRMFWARIGGVIATFIVALVFINRRIFWVYPAIVLIIEIGLFGFVTPRESILSLAEPILFKFGTMFKKFGLDYYFICNGVLLFLIGVFLLFYGVRNIRKVVP